MQLPRAKHLVGVGEVVKVLAGEQVDALHVEARLLQRGLGLLSDLHKGLLHLHRMEAVLCCDDLLCHLWAPVLARNCCQAVHGPACSRRGYQLKSVTQSACDEIYNM